MRTLLLFLMLSCLLPYPVSARPAPRLPRPTHVVIVVEENHTLAQVIGSQRAGFLESLARTSALFTDSHGVTHPSLPNYLALFAGITNDNGDGCPAEGISPSAPNLGSELLAAHYSFAGFAEDLPALGSQVCATSSYARKHAPWVAFSNVPAQDNRPLTMLPNDFDRLPTVSFIIPNVYDDMHSGTVTAADDWASVHTGALVTWARTHNSLIIYTWDEGYDRTNSIPTFFYGPMVRAGIYSQRIDHYDVLRTLEAMYGLPLTGRAASANVITGIWR